MAGLWGRGMDRGQGNNSLTYFIAIFSIFQEVATQKIKNILREDKGVTSLVYLEPDPNIII